MSFIGSGALPFVSYTIGGINALAAKVVSSFVYQETATAHHASHLLTFTDPVVDAKEDLILRGKDDVTIQFGWRGPSSALPASTPKVARVLTYKTRLELNASKVVVYGSDPSTLINEDVKCRAFSNMKISDMVTQIANENGFIPFVDATDNGNLTFRQIWLSDMQFIKYILLPRARADTGRAEYEFYIRDGKELHFRNAAYAANISKKYVYGNAVGDVIDFISGYHGPAAAHLGGGKMTATGYDISNKKLLSVNVSAGDTPEKEVLGAKTPQSFAQIGRYFALPFRTQDEVQDWASHRYYTASKLNNSAVLKLVGDPEVHAGDIIDFEYYKPFTGEPHQSSGRYKVMKAIHEISYGTDSDAGYTTTLLLVRRDTKKGDQPSVGVKRVPKLEKQDPYLARGVTKESQILDLSAQGAFIQIPGFKEELAKVIRENPGLDRGLARTVAANNLALKARGVQQNPHINPNP